MDINILKDKDIKSVLRFDKEKFIVTTKDINNSDNDTWYFLCKIEKPEFINIYDTPTSSMSIGALVEDGLISIISTMIVHLIDEDLDARHFIYSDYRGLTNRICDTYFEIYSIYTEKEYRNRGLTKEFVNIVLTDLYKNEKDYNHETCIFTQAAISSLEYSEEVYNNLTDKEKDKLINDSISFCEKCGFVNVNKLSDFEESCNMYFIPDLAARSLIEFFNRALENKTKELLDMYRDLTEKRDNNGSKQ